MKYEGADWKWLEMQNGIIFFLYALQYLAATLILLSVGWMFLIM